MNQSETSQTDLPYVLAMTGASGSVYGLRLLEVMLKSGLTVHFTCSAAAQQVFLTEQQREISLERLQLTDLFPGQEWTTSAESRFHYFHQSDFGAGMASGSYRTAGMAIVPCSMGTLASIAQGMSTNLIQRAADVHLKERRKLVLVPRETPLGSIQLENMKRVCDAGAVLLPAMPGFYHQPESIDDLVDFIVARICDQLAISHQLIKRWSEE